MNSNQVLPKHGYRGPREIADFVGMSHFRY
jgi:hypothetical protein